MKPLFYRGGNKHDSCSVEQDIEYTCSFTVNLSNCPWVWKKYKYTLFIERHMTVRSNNS
jgi:hypothetical protein